MKKVSYEEPRPYEFVVSQIAINGTRLFYAPSELVLSDTRRALGSCVGCVDAPCLLFTQAELARVAPIESGVSPDTAVCPTGAIRMNESRVPVVDEAMCIGCGLCVVRCPFGAISVSPDDGIACVQAPHEPDFVYSNEIDLRLTRTRNQSIPSVLPVTSIQDASGDISRQFMRFLEVSQLLADSQRSMRLLARNSFLISDLPARLRNAGDTNAWIDMISSVGDRVLVVEIEPGQDTLDAVRRVLSGAAIAISRHNLDAKSVVGAVVFPRFPNSRVDFYRVLRDVRNRVGLTIVPVPVSMMQLSNRSGGTLLHQYLDSYIMSNAESPTSLIARDLFGDVGDPVLLGLEPFK